MKDPGTLDLQKHILPSGSFEEAKRRLAKAVLLFQDKFVDLRVDSGSLVQVRKTSSADCLVQPMYNVTRPLLRQRRALTRCCRSKAASERLRAVTYGFTTLEQQQLGLTLVKRQHSCLRSQAGLPTPCA